MDPKLSTGVNAEERVGLVQLLVWRLGSVFSATSGIHNVCKRPEMGIWRVGKGDRVGWEAAYLYELNMVNETISCKENIFKVIIQTQT